MLALRESFKIYYNMNWNTAIDDGTREQLRTETQRNGDTDEEDISNSQSEHQSTDSEDFDEIYNEEMQRFHLTTRSSHG